MNYDSDDALDRALFALPLEEAPTDLRSSILAATVYRPAPMFSTVEVIVLSVIAAAIAVLLSAVVMSGGTLFAHSLQAIGNVATRTLSSYSTLGWLAAGGATAIWLSLFTGFQSIAVPSRKVGGTTQR